MKSTPRIGTATDAKGEFRLQGIPSGKQTIVFTFIGMVPFEVEYANQRDLEVVLKEDATQVNEVVVTGIYSRDKTASPVRRRPTRARSCGPSARRMSFRVSKRSNRP